MAWSYYDPKDDPKDQVRLLIMDTDADDPQLQDEEIGWLLTENGSDVYLTAISACRRLILRYSRKANKSTGNLSIQAASIADNYRTALRTLRSEAHHHIPAAPYAGGISQSDMEAEREDADRVDPSFAIGMDDYPSQAPDAGFIRAMPGS